MDYAARLNSESVKSQAAAAVFLSGEGIKGAKHLPALLEKCKAIDTTKELDRDKRTLLGFGAMTMGNIVGVIGFNSADSLHTSILHWLLQSTTCKDIDIAGWAMIGLGNLRAPLPEAIDRLREIVNAGRRSDDNQELSLRGHAVRMLRRLMPDFAAEYVETPAFAEYDEAIDHWLENSETTSEKRRTELQAERDWLQTIKNQRTRQ